MLGKRVAPVVVPAVPMVRITTITVRPVTSRHWESGRLTGQEAFCSDAFDRIAGVTGIAQLDTPVIVGGARQVVCSACTRVLSPCALAPPERQHNQHCDRYQDRSNHRLTTSTWPWRGTAGNSTFRAQVSLRMQVGTHHGCAGWQRAGKRRPPKRALEETRAGYLPGGMPH
jgi:hypothetical protein